MHTFLRLPKGMYFRLSLVTLDCPLGWIFNRRDAIVGARIMAQRFRKRKECLCRMLITTASASTLKWNVRDCYTSELSSSRVLHEVMQQEHAASTAEIRIRYSIVTERSRATGAACGAR